LFCPVVVRDFGAVHSDAPLPRAPLMADFF